MALRSRLITDPHEVFRIIDNMSDDDNLSCEDDNSSDVDEISPVLGQSDNDTEASEGIDSDHDDPTPGPSGSGYVGRHIPDPVSSGSDTELDEGPATGTTMTTASTTSTVTRSSTSLRARGRAQQRVAVPTSERSRSLTATRQPVTGRGRTMGRGRVPVRACSTSRDRGWHQTFTLRQNTVEFVTNVGPTFRRNRLPANVSPIHMFELFFDDPVINLFIERTNLNHDRKKAAHPNKNQSSWQATSSREMKAFFGIAIAIRTHNLVKKKPQQLKVKMQQYAYARAVYAQHGYVSSHTDSE